MLEEMLERAASLAVEMGEDGNLSKSVAVAEDQWEDWLGKEDQWEDMHRILDEVDEQTERERTEHEVQWRWEQKSKSEEQVTVTPKRRRGWPKKVFASPQNYRRMTDFLTRKKSDMELGAGGGAVMGGGEGSRAPHNKPITSGQLREAMEMFLSVDKVCNPEVGPASVEPLCVD